MASNLGGFFVTLKMASDQASFDKSKKDLGEVKKQTKETKEEFIDFTSKAIAGLAAMGAAAISAAYEVAKIQGKTQLAAAKSGMTFSELQDWRNMLSLLTLDTNSLTQGFQNVYSAVNDFKGGFKTESWNALATNLALLGIQPSEFAKMKPGQQLMTVAGAVEKAPKDKQKSFLDIADAIFPGLGDVILQTKRKGTKYTSVEKAYEAGQQASIFVDEEKVTKANEAASAFSTAGANLGAAAAGFAGTVFDVNGKLQTAADNFQATAEVLARPYDDEKSTKAILNSPYMKSMTDKANAYEKQVLDAWKIREKELKSAGASKKDIEAEKAKWGITHYFLFGDKLTGPRTSLAKSLEFAVAGEETAKKLVKPVDIANIEKSYPVGSTYNVGAITYTIDKSVLEDAAAMTKLVDGSSSPEAVRGYLETALIRKALSQ